MRRRPDPIAALLALLVLLAPVAARAEGWKMVFADDFSGTALDRTRWATRYIYGFETLSYLTNEVQRFNDKDVHRVDQGSLALIARVAPGKGPLRFDAGMIRSRQTFYYGYFEARVFLPTAKGSFPAFWLNSDYDADGKAGWPPEIDAFEFVQNKNETPDMIHSATHPSKRDPEANAYLYRNPRYTEKHGYYRATGPLNTSWQTIGLLWKPDTVTSYLNGEKLWTRRFRWVDKKDVFAAPAHILLNFAVGGDWAGEGGIDVASFPQQFKIDYVHVCQFTGGREGQPTCGGSPYTPGLAEGRYRAAGDMPKSYLSLASLMPSSNGRIALRLAINAVPTGKDHLINLVATDRKGGRPMLIARFKPTQPSSQWRGGLDMTGRFCPPPMLAGGNYDIWLGIGSPDGKGDWQNIPLTAADSFGVRSNHLRYRIGTVAIGNPASRSCSKANG